MLEHHEHRSLQAEGTLVPLMKVFHSFREREILCRLEFPSEWRDGILDHPEREPHHEGQKRRKIEQRPVKMKRQLMKLLWIEIKSICGESLHEAFKRLLPGKRNHIKNGTSSDFSRVTTSNAQV